MSRRALVSAAWLVACFSASTTAAAGAPPPSAARAALHVGTVVGEDLQWRSTIVLPPDGDGAPLRLRLAAPLPPGETLDAAPGVHAVFERDGIVAVDFAAAPEGVAVLRFTQPNARRAARAHLGAPLVEGDAIQIVDVAGDGGARFEPAAELGLDRTVTELVQPGISLGDRGAAIAELDYHAPLGAVPLVLRADAALVARGGIDGTLTTFAERRRGAAAGISVAFIAAIIALWALQRRLGRAAHEEEAERALAAEYDALSRDVRR